MLEHNARAFSLQSRHLRHSADAVPTRTNGEQNSNEKNLSKTPEKHNSLLTFMKKKKQDTESRLPADFVTPKLENLTIDILIETLKADTRYCIRTSSKVKRTALSEKPWIELNRYTKKVRIFYRVLTTIQEFGETDQSGWDLYFFHLYFPFEEQKFILFFFFFQRQFKKEISGKFSKR